MVFTVELVSVSARSPEAARPNPPAPVSSLSPGSRGIDGSEALWLAPDEAILAASDGIVQVCGPLAMRLASAWCRDHRRFLAQSRACLSVHTTDIRMEPSGFSGQFGRLRDGANLPILPEMSSQANQAVDSDTNKEINAQAPVDV